MINKNSSGALNRDLMKDFAKHRINLNPQQSKMTKTAKTFSRNDDSPHLGVNTTFGDRSGGDEAFKLKSAHKPDEGTVSMDPKRKPSTELDDGTGTITAARQSSEIPTPFGAFAAKKRMSLPPVQQRLKSKDPHIETLLSAMRTPTNPRVNIKFAKALKECSDARKKGPKLISEFSPGHFKALFGLITSRDEVGGTPQARTVRNPFVARAIAPRLAKPSAQQIEIQNNQLLLDQIVQEIAQNDPD